MPIVTADALGADYDLCIVGSGPAGLACALRAHDRGLKVLLLEAGGHQPTPGEPDLLAADALDDRWHDPVEIVAASALGGSSHWWGGRSVPFDPVDFRFWPLTYDELLPWWDEAAAFLGSRSVVESPAPGAFAKLSRFDALRSECWGALINMARRWKERIRAADGPAILLNTRVTGLTFAGGKVTAIALHHHGEKRSIAPKGDVVLACGGLGVMRLLLMAQRETPALFGGADGPLGRGYMGHLTGSTAQLIPASIEDAKGFACQPLGGGAFARRRMRPRPKTVTGEHICNIAFWLENADINDPTQGSAVASARFLAARALTIVKTRRLSHEGAPVGPHLATVLRSPLPALQGLWTAAFLLVNARLRGRHPRSTILLPNSRGAMPLYYHAEQRRDPSNRVSLAGSTDSLGLPRLKIDFRFSDDDIARVVKAHDLLDADLQAAGAGRLIWLGGREKAEARVRDAARDGYHQMGGTVMHPDPGQGVVDTHCRVHGLANLWVASSSVFPSGSQANPTLTITALACRIADQIRPAASHSLMARSEGAGS